MLRAFQNDGGANPPNQGDDAQPPRGNHNGGVLRFGMDGKLYLIFGDQGRRGRLRNTIVIVLDDQFGGPDPDDAHFTGVVIRLSDDGTTDNPFSGYGATVGGQAGANIQRIFGRCSTCS